jgi:hypothetical protein
MEFIVHNNKILKKIFNISAKQFHRNIFAIMLFFNLRFVSGIPTINNVLFNQNVTNYKLIDARCINIYVYGKITLIVNKLLHAKLF